MKETAILYTMLVCMFFMLAMHEGNFGHMLTMCIYSLGAFLSMHVLRSYIRDMWEV